MKWLHERLQKSKNTTTEQTNKKADANTPSTHIDITRAAASNIHDTLPAAQKRDQPAGPSDQDRVLPSKLSTLVTKVSPNKPPTLEQRFIALRGSDLHPSISAFDSFKKAHVYEKAWSMFTNNQNYTDQQLEAGIDPPSDQAVKIAQTRYIQEIVSGSYHVDNSQAATTAKSMLRNEVQEKIRYLTQHKNSIESQTEELGKVQQELNELKQENDNQLRQASEHIGPLKREIRQHEQALTHIQAYHAEIQSQPDSTEKDFISARLYKEWCLTQNALSDARIQHHRILQASIQTSLSYTDKAIQAIDAKQKLIRLTAQIEEDPQLKREKDKLEQESNRLRDNLEKQERSIQQEDSKRTSIDAFAQINGDIQSHRMSLVEPLQEEQSTHRSIRKKADALHQQEVQQHEQTLTSIEHYQAEIQSSPESQEKDLMHALLHRESCLAQNALIDSQIQQLSVSQTATQSRLVYVQKKLELNAMENTMLSSIGVLDKYPELGQERQQLRQEVAKLQSNIQRYTQSLQRKQDRRTSTDTLTQINGDIQSHWMSLVEPLREKQSTLHSTKKEADASFQEEIQQHEQTRTNIGRYQVEVQSWPDDNEKDFMQALLERELYRTQDALIDSQIQQQQMSLGTVRSRLVYIQKKQGLNAMESTMLSSIGVLDEYPELDQEEHRLHQEETQLQSDIQSYAESIQRKQGRHTPADTLTQIDREIHSHRTAILEPLWGEQYTQQIREKESHQSIQQDIEQHTQTLRQLQARSAQIEEASASTKNDFIYALVHQELCLTKNAMADARIQQLQISLKATHSKLIYIQKQQVLNSMEFEVHSLKATSVDDPKLIETERKLRQEEIGLHETIEQHESSIQQENDNKTSGDTLEEIKSNIQSLKGSILGPLWTDLNEKTISMEDTRQAYIEKIAQQEKAISDFDNHYDVVQQGPKNDLMSAFLYYQINKTTDDLATLKEKRLKKVEEIHINELAFIDEQLRLKKIEKDIYALKTPRKNNAQLDHDYANLAQEYDELQKKIEQTQRSIEQENSTRPSGDTLARAGARLNLLLTEAAEKEADRLRDSAVPISTNQRRKIQEDRTNYSDEAVIFDNHILGAIKSTDAREKDRILRSLEQEHQRFLQDQLPTSGRPLTYHPEVDNNPDQINTATVRGFHPERFISESSDYESWRRRYAEHPDSQIPAQPHVQPENTFDILQWGDNNAE